MCNKLALLVICSIIFLSGIPALAACSNTRVSIVYPTEVPASFETALLCKVSKETNSPKFKWSSENGTIKGEGQSIIWVAPSSPGMYTLSVKATDSAGRTDVSSAHIKVVSFTNTIIEVNPSITLNIPLWGDSAVTVERSVIPLNTTEIECQSPLMGLANYKYRWFCNGGKLQANGIKDGIASKVGWTPPGVPGFYTVRVVVTDDWGNSHIGSVFLNVVNAGCCGGNGVCGGQ